MSSGRKVERWRSWRFPATWATFTGLAVAAAIGIGVMLATSGAVRALGVALAGACIVVDVQLGAVLVRARRAASQRKR
jgi:hypothetical protein